MAVLEQTRFTAGELSPDLYGRTDLSHYGMGLRTALNAFVNYHGGISNRTGTEYIVPTKHPDRATRLIPFSFNTEQTYILEFGDQYMRVIKDGGQVLTASNQIFELATPYKGEDLFRLKYVQSADVMTITHPDYEPRELSRTDHDAWSLSTIAFTPSIAAPTGLSGSGGGSGSTTYRYKVTAISSNESAEESLPSNPVTLSGKNESLTADGNAINLSWSAVTGAKSYDVYKERNGVYGFIGSSENTSFKDDGISATLDDTPPNARDPFQGAGNYPRTATYHQQRLGFASTDNKPQTIYMSQSGNYNNFGFSSPPKDDDAITFTLASRQVNEIRHLVPLQDLVVLTSGGEWLVVGGNDDVLTPTSMIVRPQSYYGASHVAPILLGPQALYVQEKGSQVRNLSYSFESDGFAGQDLTVKSTHLFRDKEIIDWAYARIPFDLIWTIQDDGSLLSCVYQPEQEVVGWTRHATDGQYKSVASVSEGREDAVYFVVERVIDGQTKQYIERLHTRCFKTIDEAFFVDSGLTYDGRKAGTGQTITLLGPSWEQQTYLTARLDGGTWTTAINDDLLVLRVGDEVLRVDIVEYIDATTARVMARRNITEEFRNTPIGDWDLAKNQFAGLDHLEGKTVSILADGHVEPQDVVVSGSVELQHHGALVHIGLPYETDLQTLDLITYENKMPNRTLRRTIAAVHMVVKESRGLFAGRDADHLREHKTTRPAYVDALEPLTELLEVHIPSNWDDHGRVFIRQADPLPVTVLSIMPELAVGG